MKQSSHLKKTVWQPEELFKSHSAYSQACCYLAVCVLIYVLLELNYSYWEGRKFVFNAQLTMTVISVSTAKLLTSITKYNMPRVYTKDSREIQFWKKNVQTPVSRPNYSG